jgi:hypothetical protein
MPQGSVVRVLGARAGLPVAITIGVLMPGCWPPLGPLEI